MDTNQQQFRQLILDAICADNAMLVYKHVLANGSVHEFDGFKSSLLYHAIMSRSRMVFQMLLDIPKLDIYSGIRCCFQAVLQVNELGMLRQLVAHPSYTATNTRVLLRALQVSASAGNAEATQVLLESGADPNVLGGLPLLYATRSQDIPTVNTLLDAGASIHASDNGALRAAVHTTDRIMSRHLVSRGARLTKTLCEHANDTVFDTFRLLQTLVHEHPDAREISSRLLASPTLLNALKAFYTTQAMTVTTLTDFMSNYALTLESAVRDRTQSL